MDLDIDVDEEKNSLTPDTASQDPSTTQNPSTPSPPSQGSADGAAQVSQETKDKLRRGLEKKWDRIKKKDVIMTSAKSLHAIGEKWSGTIPQLRKIVVDFELSQSSKIYQEKLKVQTPHRSFIGRRRHWFSADYRTQSKRKKSL